MSSLPSGAAATPFRLPHPLLDRVLARLEMPFGAEPSLELLSRFYASWCQRVPFDNVRKLIHVRSENPGPLPGGDAEDFFAAWLRYGTGGTCWAGAGALHAVLQALGFDAERGIGTMLAATHIPPNHGTVRVTIEGRRYLLDSGMLCGEPLRLIDEEETSVEHPAWGVRCSYRDGKAYIAWRPLHKVDGFECRLESFGASQGEFGQRYELTRGWSPFNFQVSARINQKDSVIGIALSKAVSLLNDGQVRAVPISHEERNRILIEDLGISEELVSQIPADLPTPPPPGSRTAAGEV